MPSPQLFAWRTIDALPRSGDRVSGRIHSSRRSGNSKPRALKKVPMKTRNTPRLLGRIIAGSTALLATAYASYAGLAWLRYGTKKRRSRGEELDSLLDLYIP